jgi:hypothetical protein
VVPEQHRHTTLAAAQATTVSQGQAHPALVTKELLAEAQSDKDFTVEPSPQEQALPTLPTALLDSEWVKLGGPLLHTRVAQPVE